MDLLNYLSFNFNLHSKITVRKSTEIQKLI